MLCAVGVVQVGWVGGRLAASRQRLLVPAIDLDGR